MLASRAATSATTAAEAPAATYLGAATCAPCHERETKLWRGSHHDHAMEAASPETVRGDFADAKFVKDGVTSTFFRRGEQYVVRTDGPDGELHDYVVKYTFGWEPLQQLLLELPGGRLQALSIAWDTRPKAEGGQRWFHLHPDEKVDHTDVLHWTGPAQNWNRMCAECHSTNLKKGYDAKSGRYATTWSEIDVACEACHGPGAEHVRWAAARKSDAAKPDPAPANSGFVFQLRDTSGGAWTLAQGATIAHRTKAPSSDAQLETCGRCHARRALVWSEYRHGEPLAQTHRVALLEQGLYQSDGQIEDEVYEYGSFLQSRMHAAGVVCSDCHDPHSLKLRAEGNALCTKCHVASTYDVRTHHFHAEGSKAAQCVSCHMPEQLYMVVDARRDHGFRVPRPNLSEALGTSNACNGCHPKESPRWASAALDRWYGAARARRSSFASALHVGRTDGAHADDDLVRTARDASVPAIARATAVELLAAHPGPETTAVLRDAVRDADPLLRRAAAGSLVAVPAEGRVALGGPLLRDPVRTVRLEALDPLLDVPASTVSGEQRADLLRVIDEYRAAQAQNADGADGQVNAGTLEARLGNVDGARAAFEQAIRLQPSFAPAYVNLAELQRRGGAEREAEATLRRGLKLAPDVAALHHALGLSLVRQGRKKDALPELARASELAPADWRFAYVHAIALHDAGEPGRAIEVLKGAQRRHPEQAEILSALMQYEDAAGDREASLRWAKLLLEATGDPRVRELIERQQAAGTAASARP